MGQALSQPALKAKRRQILGTDARDQRSFLRHIDYGVA
jgi:hypothetical protein